MATGCAKVNRYFSLPLPGFGSGRLLLVTLWRRGIQGHIDFPLAGQIAIGAVVGAFVGSWLAGFLPAIVIRRTFAVALLGLAAILFFKE